MFKMRSSEYALCQHAWYLCGSAGETRVSSIVAFERQTQPMSSTLANSWVLVLNHHIQKPNFDWLLVYARLHAWHIPVLQNDKSDQTLLNSRDPFENSPYSASSLKQKSEASQFFLLICYCYTQMKKQHVIV